MKKIVDLGNIDDNFIVFAVRRDIVPWIRETFGVEARIVNVPSFGGEGIYAWLTPDQALLMRLKFQ